MNTPSVGRNEPCPCGSGKKFKKCCGFNLAPELPPQPQASATPAIPGFDPNQMDPEWMAKVSQAFSRLPKGQMQKLQAVMQKAMMGKDVSRESAELEQSLPVELQGLLNQAPKLDENSSENKSEGEAVVEDSKSKKFWKKMFRK